MMYSNKLAVALKSNGKILREFKDTVYIPFGSEYSILVKNLNSGRAIVNIFLDGENVVPGGLVVNAKQEIDLERWIKNGNLKDGNRFKFIERTSKIEDHRGIKLEDGLIRVEFQFERQPIQINQIHWQATHIDNPPQFNNYIMRGFVSQPFGNLSGAIGAVGASGCSRSLGDAVYSKGTGAVFASGASAQTVSLSNATVAQAQSLNDVGITVPGSKSDQKFSTASWFPTETEQHTLVLKILGETPDNKPVATPITVKAKPKCSTCGKLNKATSKFCSDCGTALEMY